MSNLWDWRTTTVLRDQGTVGIKCYGKCSVEVLWVKFTAIYYNATAREQLLTIRYSRHLEKRLVLRKIARDLPKHVFEKAVEHYIDRETGHNIAFTRAMIYGRTRDIMVAYTYEENYVKLLTIHPLKQGQKDKRLKSGRWRKI